MIQSLSDLVSKLLSATPDLTGVDIADALWLAQFIPPSTSDPQPPDNQEDKNSVERGSSTTITPPNPKVPLFTKPTGSSDTSIDIDSDCIPAVAVRSPKGFALPNQRKIELALRPLKRRIPSRVEFELNEEATAENFAEQYLAGMRILSPVLHPVEKRWLEVALIVDCSNSMLIWQETARELGRLLTRQGFRDVHLWYIDTQNIDPQSKAAPKVLPFKRDLTTALPSSSRKLIPCRDCLFLVLTDCVAPAWQNRRIFPLLAEWGKRTSVTLLLVWPERLWSRTILRDISFFVSGCQPALPNVRLTAEQWTDSFEEKPSNHGVLIPVVELEPNALADWARIITGMQDFWLPALDVSDFPPSIIDTKNEQSVPAKQRNPQEWVELFRATASPLAQRLAGLLASTHLVLSVMRLVQNALVPEAKLAHLAEVIGSGLIYRVVDDESSIADEPVFDFIPGVRNLLRCKVTVSDTLQVLEKVGKFISKKAGQGEGFAARVPSVTGTDFILNRQTLPFARIEEEVLNSLGPIYRPLAQQLNKQVTRFEEGIFQHINNSKDNFKKDKFQFDVFLCHNSKDKPAVIEVAEQLQQQGILPWLDIWHLRPGFSWQRALEDQIDQIGAVAVFVGGSGFGPWQSQEIDAFLRAFVNRQCPVIPVLLPDAPKEPKLPVFLQGLMWVDFRLQYPEPLGQLMWGITGKKPGTTPIIQPTQTDDLASEKTKIRSFSIGNRVFAFEGEYKGKSGEVIASQNIELGMQKGYIVKLDEDSSEGEYKGKSGEVIASQNIELGMQKGYIVKLDEDSSEGEYKGKSGEVIASQNIELGMQKGYIVKLDEDSSTVCITERDLEVENLNLEDINIEITNLKTQLKELAHQIPEKIAKKIPEHLAYLQEALKSKSKSEFLNEYHYISKELERTVNPDFVDSNISLKKLQHYGKNLPEL